MFKKRHYEAIASAIQDAALYAELQSDKSPAERLMGNAYVRGVNQTIKELSALFARDNGKFNRGRFERACVPGANVRSRT